MITKIIKRKGDWGANFRLSLVVQEYPSFGYNSLGRIGLSCSAGSGTSQQSRICGYQSLSEGGGKRDVSGFGQLEAVLEQEFGTGPKKPRRDIMVRVKESGK